MAKRVLAARFMHETNTFSRVPTDMAAFRRRDFHRDNEIPTAYRGTRSAFGATFEAADTYDWQLVHPISTAATPSGLVTRDAFDAVAELVLRAASEQGPFDGVLLHLHGAMVTEAHEDGEGELLTRLRGVIGPKLPVVVTLDLHANVTQAMVDHASALIAFRTYPHIDAYERALQGADLLERAMQGAIRPKTVLARRPTIYGLNHGRTQDGPMAELLKRADALEASGAALAISVCAGFTRADIRDVGPSVTVTGDGNDPRFQKIAEEFMDYAWETRNVTTIKLLPIPEVIALARQGKPGDKPLVISDYTDNPGGGGYGDATALLKAMVDAALPDVAFHAIYDPAAVQAGLKAGLGRTTLTLGGKTDPSLGGGPLTLEGEITTITNGKFIAYGPMGGGVARDHGPSLVFRVGGIDIVLITNNGQANDLGQFTSLGIDPARYRTVAVKSMHHFRAAFEPIARRIVEVDTGALCAELYSTELFRKVRRPVHPLDAL
ncbi:MAG: M81 family metallopeptidase [Proteobacteria bacterium]|nr:M81 family metallopeptidase [Pseudomonadota bacterium]